MSKNFGEAEHYILNLFKEDHKFRLEDKEYEICFSGKPTCRSGEPKTDIYVMCKNVLNDKLREIKISYKKENADFLENKITSERAEQILGKDWESIVCNSILQIKDSFLARPLIYKKEFKKTQAGSITLGWKFEFVNKNNGFLSSRLMLSDKQMLDIYAGNNLDLEKKNSSVNGRAIENSGVANYILNSVEKGISSAQEVVDNMVKIEEYIKENDKIYFACKALNYRTFEKKYDGNRPLSVYVDWNILDKKLNPIIVFNRPLSVGGDYVANRLVKCLETLNIKDTNSINLELVSDKRIIYH